MLTAEYILRIARMNEALANPDTFVCQRCDERYWIWKQHECEADREERLREVRAGRLIP